MEKEGLIMTENWKDLRKVQQEEENKMARDFLKELEDDERKEVINCARAFLASAEKFDAFISQNPGFNRETEKTFKQVLKELANNKDKDRTYY